ncbi:MAG: MMPL family transporter, partial [Acidobacteriota bacterium]
MLKIIKKLSKIIPHFSYKNYKIIILLSVMILISGTYLLKDLEIEPMLLDTKGLHGKEFKYFVDNFKRFGESTPLVLLQKHPQVEERIKNKFTDALTQELRSMKQILYVQSGPFELSDTERLIQMTRAVIFQNPAQHLPLISEKFTEQGIKREIARTRKKLVITDNPEFRETIAVDVFNLRELLEPGLRDSMANFKISPNSVYFDSEDLTSRLIFAQPRGSGEDTKYCRELIRTINTKIEKIKSSLKGSQGINCEFAGKYGLTAESFSSLNREIFLINLISSILIFILLVLVFRNLKVTLMCFLPIFFSVFVSLLVARFFFNPLKMISIGFAAIVLGLSVDITFHLSSRFFQYFKKQNSLESSIKKTLNDCGPPLIIGILTTGCGFFILNFSRYSALRQLGVLTFFSLVLTLIVTLLIFPSVVRMLRPNPKSQIKLTQLGTIPRFFTRFSVKKGTTSRIMAAALIMIALVLSLNLKFDMSLFKLLPQNLKSLNNAREVSEKFGSSFLLSTQITLEAKQISFGIQYQKYLDKQLMKYVKDKKITGFYSPTLFYIPYDEVQNNLEQVKDLSIKIKKQQNVFFNQLDAHGFNVLPSHRDYYKFWEDTFDENTLNSNSIPISLAPFLKKEENKFFLVTYVWPIRELMDPDLILDVSEDLENIPSHQHIEKKITGTYQVHQSVNKIIKKDFISISAAAGIIIALLLLFFLRKFKFMLLSLLPLLGAVPLTLAFITLASIEFSPALIGVVAIIIGIGIDDAVHLIYRRTQHLKKSFSDILNEIAPVLTLTSISTSICFLTLMFSSSPLVSNTGAIVGFGVLACWFFTMFLLPSFLPDLFIK